MSGDETAEVPPAPTTIPCPAWCARGHGHPFDHDSLMNPGLLMRDHEADVGPRVSVAADEYAVGADGPVWEVSEPRVYLDKQDGLDAAGARELAAELLRAAELLDAGDHEVPLTSESAGHRGDHGAAR